MKSSFWSKKAADENGALLIDLWSLPRTSMLQILTAGFYDCFIL